MPSSVPIVSQTELDKLHTGSLLSRLKRLQQCEESFQLSDRSGEELEPDPSITGLIEFKDTDAWRQAHSELKDILSRREHFRRAKN